MSGHFPFSHFPILHLIRAPGGSRTPNLQLRRLPLYPIELRAPIQWLAIKETEPVLAGLERVIEEPDYFVANNILNKLTKSSRRRQVMLFPGNSDMEEVPSAANFGVPLEIAETSRNLM